MLKASNKIIIVDNEQDHLNKLSGQFYERGLSCTTFEYDDFYSDPLKGVRIAFFDINLKPSGGGSDSQKISIIANAIKQYLSHDNGPYALIFWTQNKNLIDDIKKYISEREPDIPPPILVDSIDKHEFLEASKEGDLGKRVEELLNQPIIDLLFDFEKKSSIAASKVINDLFRIVPSNDNWGETKEYQENFNKVFSKIAESSLGFEHAKKEPDKAIYQALVPILEHYLNSELPDTKWEKYLTELSNANARTKLKYPEGFLASELNSVFHIVNAQGLTKSSRGAVISISKKYANFKPLIGSAYADWFNSFLSLSPGKKGKNHSMNLSIKRRSYPIVVEISAGCDFAQNKSRLQKYVLGVILPHEKDAKISPIGSSAEFIGKYYYQDKEFEMWLNLNYCIGTYSDNPILDDVLFGLKGEIVNQIGNRYANHISRIGITSF